MPIKGINVFGEGLQLLDLIYPIGCSYVQYPGFKDPNELWGSVGTVWEDVSYKFPGLSFRVSGGQAETFNKHIGENYGSTFTWDSTRTIITLPSDQGITTGSLLVDDNNDEYYSENHAERESRSVIAVSTDGLSVTIDSPFTKDLTNLLVLQNDTLQSHKHIGIRRGYHGTSHASGNTCWSVTVYPDNQEMFVDITTPTDDENSEPVRVSNETRGKNSTVRLWQRIN